MVQIKWTDVAHRDLSEIFQFISRDSHRYAKIQIERIIAAVEHLAQFPKLGKPLSEFPETHYREKGTGVYRVIYRFEEKRKRILVMSVIHSRKKLASL